MFSLTGFFSSLAPEHAKNLVVLLSLILATLVYFMYRELFVYSNDNTLYIWNVPQPDINNDTAGYEPLSTSQLVDYTLFRADNTSTTWSGTFNMHAHLLIVNDSSSLILVSWSNGLIDEDSDGQQVLYSISTTSSPSFTQPMLLFPPALRPGEVPKGKAWDALERTQCPEGFITLDDGRIFAVSELYGRMDVTNMTNEGVGYHDVGYGRVAIQIDAATGIKTGNICWIQPSRFAPFALTGTPFDLNTTTLCPDAAAMTILLSHPRHQPAWSWALLSDQHQVQGFLPNSAVTEPTHGFVFLKQPDSNAQQQHVCRFWRVLAPEEDKHSEYAECLTVNMNMNVSVSNQWFNGTDETAVGVYGPYSSIQRTNIPDANAKTFFGQFPTGNASASSRINLTHYYISNPKPNGDRFPLTIATSSNSETFNAIGYIKSTPTPVRYPGLFKNQGYQYPSAAIQVGTLLLRDDWLFVVYSVNKEDIIISRIAVVSLPRSNNSSPVEIVRDNSPQHIWVDTIALTVVALFFAALIAYLAYKLKHARDVQIERGIEIESDPIPVDVPPPSVASAGSKAWDDSDHSYSQLHAS